jgi:hypothetical protein
MGKWVITYVFLLVFLNISLRDHAAPIKATPSFSSAKHGQQQKSPLVIVNKKDRLGNCFLTHRPRIAHTPSTSFTSGDGLFSLPPNGSTGHLSLATGVERVLKDKLFHLFPYHYFW